MAKNLKDVRKSLSRNKTFGVVPDTEKVLEPGESENIALDVIKQGAILEENAKIEGIDEEEAAVLQEMGYFDLM